MKNLCDSWIRSLCGLGFILVLGGCVSIEEMNVFKSNGLEMGCAVGEVTSNEALVWVKTQGAQDVKILYGTDQAWKNSQETLLVSTSAERDFTARIPLTDLTPQTQYLYRVVVPGKKRGPVCQFKTAPHSDSPAPVTFVIGGDTRNSFRPFSIMDFMRAAQPDFFVYMGDTIYADKGQPARTLPDYWRKYAENRDGFAKQLFATTSLFVMWDDHEVDSNFTMDHQHLSVGRQAFLDYWPVRQTEQNFHRLYRSVRWGKGVELFLLDGRQYRDRKTGTMLGREQKEWLIQQLGSSSATFKFIVSSVPFSDPREDKWGEFPDERDEILGFIEEKHIPGVIFLAGDVHHASVSRMPHNSGAREFIFGPLAAPMNYQISSREPRFEFFHEASRNYGKITVQPEGPNPSVQIEWLDETNTLLHQVTVEGQDHYAYIPE